jgi:hypothetical protein
MAWDESKSTFQQRPAVAGDEKLTADEWNAHTTDQKLRGYASLATVTADYTASAQEIVLVDASGGNVTVTLPTPTDATATIIKRIDASANTVTIATPGTETIDGESAPEVDIQYEAHEIVSNGTDYFTI